MPATATARAPRAVVHTDEKPTGRQVYRLARELLTIAGLDWPETRADASALIEHVTAQRTAITTIAPTDTGEEIPF